MKLKSPLLVVPLLVLSGLLADTSQLSGTDTRGGRTVFESELLRHGYSLSTPDVGRALLTGSDDVLRMSAAIVLGLRPRIEAEPYLLAALRTEKQQFFREEIFMALARLGDMTAIKEIKSLFPFASVSRKTSFSRTLAEIGDNQGITFFRESLLSDDHFLRRDALNNLLGLMDSLYIQRGTMEKWVQELLTSTETRAKRAGVLFVPRLKTRGALTPSLEAAACHLWVTESDPELRQSLRDEFQKVTPDCKEPIRIPWRP